MKIKLVKEKIKVKKNKKEEDIKLPKEGNLIVFSSAILLADRFQVRQLRLLNRIKKQCLWIFRQVHRNIQSFGWL